MYSLLSVDCSMDMVISAGKSRKNIEAFVLIPPDCKTAIDVLIATRTSPAVGVPETNEFLFARLSADSSFSGTVELKEIALTCPGLRQPARITSTNLRKYIATVSQVCFSCVF